MTQTAQMSGFRSLFDGRTLDGWRAIPRSYGTVYPGGPTIDAICKARGIVLPDDAHQHPARWRVEDGVIVGEQATPGYGGYLLSEERFGDFELVLEANPDWPADTGVMLRRGADDWAGFQVLIDHRESGGIGGFFGNGLASFAAVPFAIRARRDDEGHVVGLEPDDLATSIEPVTAAKRGLLCHAASVEDFLNIWRWADWNEFRIRCVGELPVITTWINGLKIAEVDTATIDVAHYDPAAVLGFLGVEGHIALEVHDNDPIFGDARWGPGAQCRWRNIRIRDLGSEETAS